jgi:hydrogenase maturation protease
MTRTDRRDDEALGAGREVGRNDFAAVRIVGLGSPHGDDRAGWEAVAALAGRPLPAQVELRSCATPATELLPALHGARRVILVDAVAGGSPGTILRGGRGALAASRAGLSSHGVALDTLLDLAETCGALPPELAWVGVTIDPTRAAGESLSAAVAAALPSLSRAALEEALR